MTDFTSVGLAPLPVARGGTASTTSTGTTSLALTTSASFTTPNIGVATGTQVTFSPTTNGMIGITDASNASSGIVGEFLSVNVPLASAISLPASTPTNVASLALTAGDWDVYGNVYVSDSIAIASGSLTCSLNQASATQANASLTGQTVTATTSTAFSCVINPIRASLSSSGTVYLIANSGAAGTLVVCGNIWARRVR